MSVLGGPSWGRSPYGLASQGACRIKLNILSGKCISRPLDVTIKY